METASEKRFPVNANDYKLYEEVGEGVSATVYRALCIPLNEIVAIKVLDLEKCNSDLDGIRREVQTMTLIYHTNVLRAHCSFTTGHSLWVVMPYMAGGSCLHIMKSAYPEGLEEPVIATLLREVLKALVYLHAHGHIHRDVKAGNILVDFDGSVKLADFGVSASMFDSGDRLRSRNTFVGTPCWMAPEVMQQLHGYDFKADIWSLGITALELAHGHAPFSKYPPMKVLLMTLQNAPPGFDYERDKRFSKSFKEMVALCLVKDPKKRPTSEKLLRHPFFKYGRTNDYIARTILDGLAPLGDRFKMLKAKESDLLAQSKAMYEDKDKLSQQEYIRGISAWNFNLEDLKSQAALIQDVDIGYAEVSDVSKIQREKNDSYGLRVERSSIEQMKHLNPTTSQEDEFTELHDLASSFASMPAKPLEALRGCFDIGDEDIKATSPRALDQENGFEDECSGQSSSLCHGMPEHKKYLSGSLLPNRAIFSKKVNVDSDRDNPQSKYLSDRNYSGSLLYHQKRDTNSHSSAEDLSEGAIVQRKGRFKVTSADLSSKGSTSVLLNPGSGVNPTIPHLTAATVFPSLQSILQQHTLQREEIIKLIKYLEQVSGKCSDPVELATSNLSQISSSSTRERVLNSQLIHLQQRVDSLFEELERQKLKNVQLERELNALVGSKEGKLEKRNDE